jgi:outer membrane biosynthesis protein TonB
MLRNSSKVRASINVLAFAMMFTTFLPANLPAQDDRQAVVHPAPVYSEFAKKLQVSGVVKVKVLIGADGRIKDIKVIGGHPVLVDCVQTALKDWRYAPAGGETTKDLEFHFHP